VSGVRLPFAAQHGVFRDAAAADTPAVLDSSMILLPHDCPVSTAIALNLPIFEDGCLMRKSVSDSSEGWANSSV
jgi:hypothetical protein